MAKRWNELPRDVMWPIGMACLAEACAYLGDTVNSRQLYDSILPSANRNVVLPYATGCLGSVSYFLGLLARTMSEWDAAVQHFEEALRMNAALQAPPLVARTQLEYARMLLARGQPTDRARTHSLLTEATATFEQLGMQECLQRAREMRGQVRIPDAGGSESNDLGRLERVREEIDFLTVHLTKTSRMFGASRSAPTSTERARINVKNSINVVLQALAPQDDQLFRHLRNSVKTGAFCSYAPDHDIVWEF